MGPGPIKKKRAAQPRVLTYAPQAVLFPWQTDSAGVCTQQTPPISGKHTRYWRHVIFPSTMSAISRAVSFSSFLASFNSRRYLPG